MTINLSPTNWIPEPSQLAPSLFMPAHYPAFASTPATYQTPQSMPTYNYQRLPYWSSAQPAYGPPPSPPNNQVPPAIQALSIPTNAPEITKALEVLCQTVNLPQDEAALREMGVNVIFHSGQEAVDVIRRRGAKVIFGDMGDTNAHAEWVQDRNAIIINQRYRGRIDFPTILAIAAAIYHEAGHAVHFGDSYSSIQEEVDCLALNSMAYRSHCVMFPWYATYLPKGPQRALFQNGVALYPRLFFDPDPYKRGLVNRVIDKYGMLPPDSPDHPIPHLPNGPTVVERILREIHRRNSFLFFSQNYLNG